MFAMIVSSIVLAHCVDYYLVWLRRRQMPKLVACRIRNLTEAYAVSLLLLSQRHRLSQLDLYPRRCGSLRVFIEKNVRAAIFPFAIKVTPHNAIFIRAKYAPR
jgi:hypothetical protein